MLRTRSPSARAAEAAERQVRLQRRQQRQQQQQEQQQANKPVTSPALRNELALNCLSTESNTKINRNGSINISNNDHSTNAIVASAVTPASTRGKGRFSFGPVPNERYSIESGLSFSFSSPSPPPSDDRSCSRTPAPPSPHLQQGGPPPANDGSNNGSESSSCAVIDVNGIDAETNDDHIAYTDQDLLSTSTTSSIELARQLDHASLVLPPHEEIFGFDSPDKKQQQLQHDDLEPIPFIHGSGNSMPDAAVFDFDVDKIDGLIGELAEEEQEEHDQSLAGKLCGQSEQQQQQQEEQQPQQPPPQLQQQDHHHLHHQQQDTQEDKGEGGQEDQQQAQQAQQAQQDTRKGKGEGEESTINSATAVPATTAAFMGPAPAIWADPAIQHAIANAMDVASNANYMTQEAYTHAAALAAQSQVQVGIAWQVVVSAMHTVAVSLKADNEKLLASNAELEAEKRGFIRQISRLGDTVSTLITQRDRLAADLRESGTGSPTKTSAKGNRTRDDSGCVVYDCTSPASGMGMFLATPASATTLCDRTAEAAAATAAAVAAFSTPTVKPAMVSRTGTVTGQPGSMMTTAAVPAVMNAIKETITTTMAPQQCEVGLPIQTIPPSGSQFAIAAPPTTTSTAALSILASTAKPGALTTTIENPKHADRPMPVSSTAAAAFTTTTPATAAAPAAVSTALAASTPSSTTAAAATPAAASTALTVPTAAAAAPTAASTTNITDAAPIAAALIASPNAPTAPTSTAATATTVTATTIAATTPIPSSVRPKMAADKSRRRSVKTPGSTTGGRAPWVGGGVGGGAFPSPPIVGNREKDASPSVSLSERLENEMRQEDAKRTPLGSSRINTGPRSVSSTAGKGRKASPCISTPPLAQASSTRGIENQPREGNKPRATVAVKRIIADDRGATDGNQPNPEGMYGRLRSAGRPRKMKTKVVAGGGKKVVSGTGVSSRSRQEAAANRGAAGGRSKAAPKQRWR